MKSPPVSPSSGLPMLDVTPTDTHPLKPPALPASMPPAAAAAASPATRRSSAPLGSADVTAAAPVDERLAMPPPAPCPPLACSSIIF